jgi:hypothetical protein
VVPTKNLRQQRAAELIAALTLPRSSWARSLALTGLALLLLVQTLSLVSRPTVKEAPPEFEPMAAEEQPQQLYRSYATKGLEPQTSRPQTGLLLTRLSLALDRALLTEWGANVTAENAWREYPRPQLVRGDASWRCLNGLWEYAISAAKAPPPSAFEGSILVPFPLESKLSGVQRLLRPTEALWYRRTFEAEPRPSERQFLRFEAVDYTAEVWLNGVPLGYHTGGFTPFAFEVSAAMKAAAAAAGGLHTLLVRVLDPTDGTQLRGKQSPQAVDTRTLALAPTPTLTLTLSRPSTLLP